MVHTVNEEPSAPRGKSNEIEVIRERAGYYESGVLASEDIATLLHKVDEQAAEIRTLKNDNARWQESRDIFAQQTIDLKARIAKLENQAP